MSFKHALHIVFIGAALSGCSAVTESKYEAMQKTFAGNATVRQNVVQHCGNRIDGRAPARETYAMARLMRVPPEQAPYTFCARMASALASKRITYKEFMAAERGNRSPNVMRILRGR